MSGGSYDYAFGRIEDLAMNIATHARTPLRRAFAAHLRLVAKAAHDIEWVDSGDFARGDEEEAIRACLQPGAGLAILIKEATEARDRLSAELERAAGAGKDGGR